ncbi:hypothetical protein D3C81_2113710 [compost metagenome]
MARAALHRDVASGQVCLHSIVEFEPDVAVEHDVVVKGICGVHARMFVLKQFGKAR